MYRALVCSLFLLIPFGLMAQSHKALFESGQEAFRNEDFDKAIELFTKAIEKNNAKFPPAIMRMYTYVNWRGTAYARSGKYEAAIKDLSWLIKNRKSWEADENNEYYWKPIKTNSDHYWRGYSHYQLGNYLLAIDDFEVSTSLGSAPMWDYYYKGQSLYELDRYQEALKAFNQAFVAGLDNVSVYNSKARADYQLGDYQQSYSNYQKAYELDKKDLSNLGGQGVSLAHMGQYDKALEKIETAISLAPEEPYYYFMKARIHAIFNKRIEAIKSMEKSFELGFENWTSLTTYFDDFGSLKTDPRFLQLLIENDAQVALMDSGTNQELLANLTSQKARNVSYVEITSAEESGSSPIPAGASDYDFKAALVIGNSSYDHAPLKNPINDALLMASELRSVGFEVTDLYDLDRSGMKQGIREFANTINGKSGVVLFYFAGHGLQSGGSNFLVPVKADIENDYEIEDECVNLNQVLRMMQQFNKDMNIVILDACRNNPYGSATRSTQQKGLGKPEFAPTGTIIAYATAPGKTALDGEGSNGLYTSELVKAMRVQGNTIEEVFKQVRVNVIKLSNGQQNPWENSSLVGDFYFRK